MTIIILYVLAVLTFFSWILGWGLWHSYLAVSRFFMGQHHKSPAAPQFPGRAADVLPIGGGRELFKTAHFQAGRCHR